MDPTLRAFLLSWDWRIDIISVVLFFGALYTMGWLRLRSKQAKLANGWRLASYYGGLLTLAIALMSGIDTFQTQLFFIHMIQHFLLVMIAPILLFLANPMPFILWAIPSPERRQIGRLLTQNSRFRRWLVAVTASGLVWLVYSINLILWHDPSPYNSAITNEFLHDMEHLSFFLTGMALWWHIIDAAPKFHKRRTYAMRLGLIVATYFGNLVLGVAITMSPDLIYTHYKTVPRIWVESAHRDQTIGGLVMWLPGGMMYLLVFLLLIARMMINAEQKQRLSDQQRLLQAQEAATS